MPPDLWDVNLSDWSNDSQTARFADEGYQEPYTAFVKSVTTKPVVGVGRYTSPDTMARLVTSGHLDFIGAARPSIADPFLPNKIDAGRVEDIRECIGCNICVSGDNTCVPMRCTQNPAVGEEWRRDWHPERVNKIQTKETCLVIGGGPAGLEAARVLGERGFTVTLADAADRWGGRINDEAALPGLSSWSRVCDWRVQQLQRMPAVSMYLQNTLSVNDVLEFDADHVAIATGAHWRIDGVGRAHRLPLSFLQNDLVVDTNHVLRDVNALQDCQGAVVIYDDDRFYLASALAEQVVKAGHRCVFVTPAAVVSPWAEHTLEQTRIQKRLLELNVEVITGHTLAQLEGDELTLSCVYSEEQESSWQAAGVKSIRAMGDCYAPGLIAAAVHSGHGIARAVGLNAEPIVRREDNLLIHHAGV